MHECSRSILQNQWISYISLNTVVTNIILDIHIYLTDINKVSNYTWIVPNRCIHQSSSPTLLRNTSKTFYWKMHYAIFRTLSWRWGLQNPTSKSNWASVYCPKRQEYMSAILPIYSNNDSSSANHPSKHNLPNPILCIDIYFTNFQQETNDIGPFFLTCMDKGRVAKLWCTFDQVIIITSNFPLIFTLSVEFTSRLMISGCWWNWL